MELLCEVQNYDWGKVGKESEVSSLAKSNNPKLQINDSIPYAEFWMGTHPNGESTILSTGEKLYCWLKKNPDSLGISKDKFGNDLSFLFKVLSIRKPLSIQIHPNKFQAEKLHQEKPDLYKDSNHKPEMAIALTTFEVLIGFRPYYEIKKFMEEVPELRTLMKHDNVLRFLKQENGGEHLKECFSTLMNQSEQNVKDAVNLLLCRLKYATEAVKDQQLYSLAKRLNAEFKDDVGIFGIYLFNYMKLQPGDAIYLPANLPHAYLSGDCVECMACSDNVVRAGLTPKMKDVDTLISLLDYRGYSTENLCLKGHVLDSHSVSFAPPIPDFSVTVIKVEIESSYMIPKRPSASILFVQEGKGMYENDKPLGRGTVLFLPAYSDLYVTAISDLVAYHAYTNDALL